MMFFFSFIIFIYISSTESCGTDVSGTPGLSAKFTISSFAPPIPYTYNDQGAAITNQPKLKKDALDNASVDLKAAISKALKDNQLTLSTPPTLKLDFDPLPAKIDNGGECKAPDTCIAISGTVLYNCTTADPKDSKPVEQKMVVTATSVQQLYEGQWKSISKSVQTSLEAKKMLFFEDISVEVQ